MSSMKLIATALALVLTIQAHAELGPNEPAFCELQTFLNTEIDSTTPGLVRSHAYQLGHLIVAGMAVGNSKVPSTQALANKFGQYDSTEKSCTWYFNNGNREATNTFNSFPLSNPAYKGDKKAADEFETKLTNIFANNPVSFLSCAMKRGYIGMGCDGQKHRGPSVFAMFLAYAGCSPKNAVAIANKVWGTNGVPVSTREAIAARGQKLGDQNPEVREALQATMTTPPTY